MNFVLDLIHKLGLVLIHKLELMLESVLMHKLSLEQELLCNLQTELATGTISMLKIAKYLDMSKILN